MKNQQRKPMSARGKTALAVCLNVLLFFFYLAVCHMSYETNDDWGVMTFVTGIRGVFDHHLVYISSVVGHLLGGLYQVSGAINWYPLLQIVLLFLAFASVTSVFLRLENRSAAVLPLLVTVVLLFSFEGVVRLQYTKTAGLLGAAGLLLVLGSVFGRRVEKAGLLVGILLCLFSAMYRWEQFFCEAALSVPVALLVLFRALSAPKRERGRRMAVVILTGSSLLLLLGGCKWMDIAAYSSEDWQGYLRFNAARTELLDYGFPNYEKYQKEYLDAGIDETTYTLLKKWTFTDPEKLNAETLEKIAALKQPRQITLGFFKSFVKKMAAGLPKRRGFWVSAGVFFALVCSCVAGKENRRKRLLYLVPAILQGALTGCIYLYLFYKGRFLINRVDVGIWFAAAINLLWLFAVSTQQTEHDGQVRLFFTTGILALLVTVPALYGWRGYYLPDKKQEAKQQVRQTRQAALKEIQMDRDHLYLLKPGTVSYANSFAMWDEVPFGIGENQYPLGGWPANTPTYQAVLEQYGVENPFRDVVDHDAVYLVDQNIESTLAYIRRWYARDAEAILVKEVGEFSVYQIRTDRP